MAMAPCPYCGEILKASGSDIVGAIRRHQEEQRGQGAHPLVRVRKSRVAQR